MHVQITVGTPPIEVWYGERETLLAIGDTLSLDVPVMVYDPPYGDGGRVPVLRIEARMCMVTRVTNEGSRMHAQILDLPYGSVEMLTNTNARVWIRWGWRAAPLWETAPDTAYALVPTDWHGAAILAHVKELADTLVPASVPRPLVCWFEVGYVPPLAWLRAEAMRCDQDMARIAERKAQVMLTIAGDTIIIV